MIENYELMSSVRYNHQFSFGTVQGCLPDYRECPAAGGHQRKQRTHADDGSVRQGFQFQESSPHDAVCPGIRRLPDCVNTVDNNCPGRLFWKCCRLKKAPSACYSAPPGTTSKSDFSSWATPASRCLSITPNCLTKTFLKPNSRNKSPRQNSG